MSRCELTGKGPAVTNLVSHSNIKTKSISQPNIQRKRLFSPALDELVTLNVATSTIKSMEHTGNFDKFILGQPDKHLSKRALTVKRKIIKRLTGKLGKAIKTATPAAPAPAKTEKKKSAPAARTAQAKSKKK